MGWLPRTVVTATALVIVALVVPFAGAHGPMGGTENVTLTLPADGSGTVTRSPMPASSTVGTITVKTTSSDDSFFGHLTTVLSADKPTFGARAIHCVLLYAILVNGAYTPTNWEENDHSLDDLFLHVCLRLALDMSQQSGAAHHSARAAATARCGMRMAAVPVTITKTGSGYKATLNGTPYASKPPHLRVACTHTATGLRITEKPRKGKLAKAIGPKLAVGFTSKSSSPGKLKIALGVK